MPAPSAPDAPPPPYVDDPPPLYSAEEESKKPEAEERVLFLDPWGTLKPPQLTPICDKRLPILSDQARALWDAEMLKRQQVMIQWARHLFALGWDKVGRYLASGFDRMSATFFDGTQNGCPFASEKHGYLVLVDWQKSGYWMGQVFVPDFADIKGCRLALDVGWHTGSFRCSLLGVPDSVRDPWGPSDPSSPNEVFEVVEHLARGVLSS